MPRLSLRAPDLVKEVLPWPLVRAGSRWANNSLSVALLLGVLLSRLLLLPDGPWEQDEALLACGVVSFDPSLHMPLPPGFPLWIAIGRLVRWLGASDPVHALQLASSVLSVLACWALVGVWERFTGRGLAVAGALLGTFLPGIWFHAHRAFSETPSAALAIVGFACWVRGGRRGFVPGVVALVAASLVRPPLTPLFALAVALAAWRLRRDRAALLRGACAGLAMLLVVLLPAAIEAGGLRLLTSATLDHAGEHAFLLGAETITFDRLGFTRGLGTPLAAGAFAAMALLGWLALRRRLGPLWWPGCIAAAWLVYLLVFLHNPTYPRYWVLAWLLAAVPAAFGVRTVVRRPTPAALLTIVAALVSAAWTAPAVSHIHRQPLPVMGALRTVAAEARGTLVFEDQLFSFRNLGRVAGWLPVPALRLGEMHRTRLGFGAAPIWFLGEGQGQDIDSPSSQVFEATCSEPRIARLSQDRFLHARLVRNPVLIWRGGSYIEWEATYRYMWCGAQTTLLLPAIDEAGGVAFAADIFDGLERVTLVAAVNGVETLRRELPAGRHVIRVPLPRPTDARRPVEVSLDLGRAARFPGDPRLLAIRFFRASVEAPPHPVPPIVFFPETASMFASLVEGEGFYDAELMGRPAQAATWTGPRATFRVPVARGTVGVEMLATRPDPAEVEVQLGDALAKVRVGAQPASVELPVPPALARGGVANLEIRSSTFVPGPNDHRALGVAISRIWYLPPSTSPLDRH